MKTPVMVNNKRCFYFVLFFAVHDLWMPSKEIENYEKEQQIMSSIFNNWEQIIWVCVYNKVSIVDMEK